MKYSIAIDHTSMVNISKREHQFRLLKDAINVIKNFAGVELRQVLGPNDSIMFEFQTDHELTTPVKDAMYDIKTIVGLDKAWKEGCVHDMKSVQYLCSQEHGVIEVYRCSMCGDSEWKKIKQMKSF